MSKETKHEKFLRLVKTRLKATKESLRLLRQLSSTNYEHTMEEAQSVIWYVTHDLNSVANAFGVDFVATIGKSKTNAFLPDGTRKVGSLDEVRVLQIAELIETDPAAAKEMLLNTLSGDVG